MWKHAEQQSFHLTDAEYMEQLEAVSELISEWVRSPPATLHAPSASRGPDAHERDIHQFTRCSCRVTRGAGMRISARPNHDMSRSTTRALTQKERGTHQFTKLYAPCHGLPSVDNIVCACTHPRVRDDA